MRASLFACVCVAECKRQYVARYKTTYRPQNEAHKHTYTVTYTHTLAHTRKQPECTGKNCGKLHEITKQRSHWAFRSHILLAVAAVVVVFIACLLLSPPERSTIVFMSLLFNCTHFRFRFGQELRCLLSPRFYIPIQRHTRSLFCFVATAAAATTSCPQITPHPPRQQRQNVNNNNITIP